MTKEQITQILIDNSEHILDYLDNDRIAVEKEDFSDVADAILKLCEVMQQSEQLCINCKEKPANKGLGKHKLICSDCWNSLCD